MKKLILMLCMLLLLCSCVDGATKIGLDRLNWSQSLPSGENITLDGGFINGMSTDMYISPMTFGTTGDGLTDDAEAIQNASDAAHALWETDGIMRTICFPPGIYLINSSQVTSEILLKPRPGVKYRGSGMGQTIIRAPAEWRNASNGVSLFFNTDEYLNGLEVSGITFDYGTEVFVPGDAFATRIGANHIQNAIFDNVEVINASGSWCFVLGNGTEDNYSKNVLVSNCRFLNSGDSKSGDATADFTCIYMSASNSTIRNCDFINDNLMRNGTAVEFHNSGIKGTHNIIKNFAYGAHLGAQKDIPTTSTGQIFSNNVIYAMVGVDYWTTTSTDIWQDAVISGNTIYLIHRDPIDLVVGIGTGVHNGHAYNISITDNKILNSNAHGGTYASAGIILHDVNSGIVANNEIINVTRGIQTQYVENLTELVITGNTVRGWGYGFTNGIYTPAFQLDFSREMDGGHVVVANNVAITNEYPEYGIVVWGQNLTYLDIVNNVINGTSVSDIYMRGSYTDEKVYINHVSRKSGPGTNYAINGSLWQDLTAGIDYRHDGSWKAITYAYS